MFLLDLPGSFMILQHHLNLKTRCQIQPVLTSPMEPVDILLALSYTFLFQWRCIVFFPLLFGFHLFPECQHIVGKKMYGLATCKN